MKCNVTIYLSILYKGICCFMFAIESVSTKASSRKCKIMTNDEITLILFVMEMNASNIKIQGAAEWSITFHKSDDQALV